MCGRHKDVHIDYNLYPQLCEYYFHSQAVLSLIHVLRSIGITRREPGALSR